MDRYQEESQWHEQIIIIERVVPNFRRNSQIQQIKLQFAKYQSILRGKKREK